jgi:hypothetical protein
MKKIYLKYLPVLFLMVFAASCKKDNKVVPDNDSNNYAKLGLYEQLSGSNRRLYVAISRVGTQSINQGLVFDTGSTGMTIDANGILPASMITASGFQITGDSVTVNGITVTNQHAIISYGGVDGTIEEYGNLAYAPVTVGDVQGNITTPRIPIFLYYKVVNKNTGAQLPVHSADVFGVGPGSSHANRLIGSPLSYFKLPGNYTSGFRLARLTAAGFGSSLTYVASLLYIGLNDADLNASNFIMHPLSLAGAEGYSPNIRSTINYNGQSIPGTILFDTGTPVTTIISDSDVPFNSQTLPANTSVTITTNNGFSYQYTTAANFNLTQVQNPSYSNDIRTIFSINFFMSNEYLLDYANHRIGLKNN